jgi:hypothetical protein
MSVIVSFGVCSQYGRAEQPTLSSDLSAETDPQRNPPADPTSIDALQGHDASKSADAGEPIEQAKSPAEQGKTEERAGTLSFETEAQKGTPKLDGRVVAESSQNPANHRTNNKSGFNNRSMEVVLAPIIYPIALVVSARIMYNFFSKAITGSDLRTSLKTKSPFAAR